MGDGRGVGRKLPWTRSAEGLPRIRGQQPGRAPRARAAWRAQQLQSLPEAENHRRQKTQTRSQRGLYRQGGSEGGR